MMSIWIIEQNENWHKKKYYEIYQGKTIKNSILDFCPSIDYDNGDEPRWKGLETERKRRSGSSSVWGG